MSIFIILSKLYYLCEYNVLIIFIWTYLSPTFLQFCTCLLYEKFQSRLYEKKWFDLNLFIRRSSNPLILCFTCLPRQYYHSQIRTDPSLSTPYADFLAPRELILTSRKIFKLSILEIYRSLNPPGSWISASLKSITFGSKRQRGKWQGRAGKKGAK